MIDALLTCGRGQRLGIFSGSGVGKSVLLGMMARYTDADVIVIGLIGERGREVNEFIERDLGAEGLARSVVVVATSNEPALARVQGRLHRHGHRRILPRQGPERAAADGLGHAVRDGPARDRPGRRRAAHHARLSALDVRLLPRLVERAGQARSGSITAFYTVLVEGDDANEPVTDTVRGLLDGHIWLSRKLAARGHYPAIDVLAEHQPPDERRRHAQNTRPPPRSIRRLLAAYAEHEDLISIGAYRRGSNRVVDAAVEMRESIEELFRQRVEHKLPWDQVIGQLQTLGAQCHDKTESRRRRRNAPQLAAAAA